MPLGTTHREAERDEAIGPAPVDARSFFMVLLIGALCSSAAFVWTVSSSGVEPEPAASASDGDPSPNWSDRFAREVYTQGRYESLAASASIRRRDWGRDPDAWLFGAFAHEALAAEPGLGAIEHRATADRLWAELLSLAADRDRNGDGVADFRMPIPDAAYLEGWALAGLGRPVMARERFGEFLSQKRSVPGRRIGAYNHACFSALAGDTDGAVRLFRTSMRSGQIGDARWGVVDPDFDGVREELWHTDLGYRAWRVFVEAERAGEVPHRPRARWFENGVGVPLSPERVRGAY